jgi:hypothetical protein
MDDMALTPPAPLGAAIAINFQPTGGGKAAITGDFVLTNDEVNPVIRALRANGIDVTAGPASRLCRARPRQSAFEAIHVGGGGESPYRHSARSGGLFCIAATEIRP